MFPPAVHEGSFFPHPLEKAFAIYVPFDDGHPGRCEVRAHCGLTCISLMINVMLASFHVPVGICISSLEKCRFISSAHF